MHIAKRNHLLTIQEKGDSDPFDSEVSTWTDMGERWFQLEPLEGDEALRAKQMESRQTHTGLCEWFADANTQMRITDGTRVWDVQSVNSMHERYRFLAWRLVEVV